MGMQVYGCMDLAHLNLGPGRELSQHLIVVAAVTVGHNLAEEEGTAWSSYWPESQPQGGYISQSVR